MQGRRVHVIGAGLAGLAAAVRLAKQGAHVRLYEAAQNAGGRCRSYVDAELGCRVDNGNHLVVSGNDAAMAYVAEIGAAATFIARDMAEFPFVDLKTGERWSVRPTDHRLPWWILLADRRVAGSQRLGLSAGAEAARRRPRRHGAGGAARTRCCMTGCGGR